MAPDTGLPPFNAGRMTENEKVEERALKVRKVVELAEVSRKRGKKIRSVWDTDPRLKVYLQEVAKNPEAHNVWEISAVVRFYEMLERYEWHPKRAKLVIRIMEMLTFKTDQGQRPIVLQPVQVFMCAVPFGLVKWVKVEHRNKMGKKVVEKKVRRVIQKVVWMVPRKFGKTTLISGLGVTEFFFGPYDAEVDVVSTTSRQAKICYNMIKLAMMDLVANHPLLQGVQLRYNRESLFYDNPLDGAAQINVFGDNPDALNGLKPSMAIEDESASMDDTPSKAGNESRNTLESGQGTREEPLSFQITTASKYVNGPFAQSLKGIKEVLAGTSKNDQLFAMLFCPDCDDREDDPRTWRKCHPMLGETVQADFYEREWAKAKDDATYINEFRTKQLNIFAVPQTEAWISSETVKKLAIDWDPLNMPLRSGVRAMMAVDLAQKWDFTAVSTAIYREDIRQIWVHTKYFLPDGVRVWVVPKTRDTIVDTSDPTYWKEDESYVYHQDQPYDGEIYSGHPNKKLYKKWIEDGKMELTHGTIVDYDAVAKYMYEVASRLRVEKIGYDDYKWQEFANHLARMGGSEALVAFGQTYGDFTAPTIFFERGVERGSILVSQSPVTEWCFSNAVLDTDARQNVKPMKLGEYRRIDGVITSVMACGLWSDLGHTRHDKNNFKD